MTNVEILNDFIKKEDKPAYEKLLCDELVSVTKDYSSAQESLNKAMEDINSKQVALVQLQAKQNTLIDVILKLVGGSVDQAV